MKAPGLQTALALCLAATLSPSSAPAQSAGSDWNQVQALPSGQSLRLSVAGHGINCSFVSADPDTLHCNAIRTVFFFPVVHRYTLTRAEVTRIKLSELGLSEFTGAAIGVAAGAVSAVALDATYSNHEDRAVLVLLFGVLGGFVGEGIGHKTDFLAGPVIYTAP